MKKLIIWLVVIVVVIFGIRWISNRGSQTSEIPPTVNTETPPAAETSTDSSNPPAAAVQTFTVTGQNYSFSPATLNVKKGDTVQIIFKNAGGNHDFRLDQFDVATERLQAGGEQTVTFIADKAGSFEYYCSVGNHRAMGMWGTLTVTE